MKEPTLKQYESLYQKKLSEAIHARIELTRFEHQLEYLEHIIAGLKVDREALKEKEAKV